MIIKIYRFSVAASIVCMMVVLSLCSCGDTNNIQTKFRQTDSLMNANPDSAYHLLMADSAGMSKRNESVRMRYELLKAKAMNKSDRLFTSDSMMKEVVDYYASHGSANEKMEAKYLLGCVYRDLDEAPEALYYYNEAVSCADTTRRDCDYNTLYQIYGQMFWIYQLQYMPEDEIKTLAKYSYYALKAGDKYEHVRGKEFMVHPYFELGDTVKVLKITDDCYNRYKNLGMNSQASSVFAAAIYIYVLQGKYNEAGHLIKKYENESGLFNKKGEIVDDRVDYYYTKGLYCIGIHQIDSAEIYFRKLLKYKKNYYAYNGLLRIYRSKGNTDSIIFFSRQLEMALDKILNDEQSQTVLQMNSLYNYTRNQNLAHKNALRASHARKAIYLIIILAISMAIICFVAYKRHDAKRKKALQKINKEYVGALNKLNATTVELNSLRSRKEDNLHALEKQKQEEIESLNEEILKYEKIIKGQTKYENEESLMNSDIIKQIRRMSIPYPGASDSIRIVDKDWMLLEGLLKQYLPQFHYFITTKKEDLTQQEYYVCVLTRLGFVNKDMAILLGTIVQRISNAKKSANKKLFNDSNTRSLKANLIHNIEDNN